MRENINSNFYIPSVKYTYTTLPVNFQRNQITDNTITSSRSNKSMTHFPHLRKIRYFTRVVIIKPLIRFFFFFQVLASRESLVESLEESESDDAILMSQVSDSFSFVRLCLDP